MAKTLTVYLAADLKKFNAGMDDASRKVQGLGGTLSSYLGPALIGAAAAAGAFAVKLGVDAVQAAIEDEAAAAKLAQTLNNLGLAHNTEPIEDYISSLENSLGVADDELRPAYDRLIRSTRDAGEANKVLAIALDVASGTGKSLDTVVQALGRAYDGNTAGLSRLGAGLDRAILATGDMDTITAQLAATFGGQAATQAGTLEGKVQRLTLAADNLKEAFGRGLLDGFAAVSKGAGDAADALVDMQDEAERAGLIIGSQLASAAQDGAETVNILADSYDAWQYRARRADSVLVGLVQTFVSTNAETTRLAKLNRGLGDSFEYTQYSAYAASDAIEDTRLSAAATTDDVEALGDSAQYAGKSFLAMYEAIYGARAAADRAARDAANTSGTVLGAIQSGVESGPDVFFLSKVTKMFETATEGVKKYGGGTSNAAKSAETLTKEQKRLTEAYEAQEGVVEGTRQQLAAYAADLAVVTEAANAYADSIRSSLMDTIDLGAAYGQQFDEEGQKTGQSLISGFEAQIAQAEWFGNVLNELKRQGADASLISEIAGLGAGVGGALGQQLITEGLVGTINDKWIGVQEAIRVQTEALIPEFLQTGIAAGTDLVTGLAQQIRDEQKTLERLGKQLAKPVGAEFKAQLAADIAEAIKSAQAATSAARAEKVAEAERAAAALTEQAVAQALGNIIGRSDARTGRPQPNVPYLVLG